MEQIPLDELRLMSVDDAEYIGALERQLTELRSKTVWHDAKEPPKEDGIYLCYCNSLWKPIRRQGFNNGKWVEEEYDDFQGCEISGESIPTRWMPLPQPPESEGE